MGTNFYHRYNTCDCCGRFDERHICKSMTSFRGYRSPEPDTLPAEVLSWADWKSEILAGGEVWSEYGYQISIEDFIADVEATDRKARRRQYDWVIAHRHDYGNPGQIRDWLDPDGFSFTDEEFC